MGQYYRPSVLNDAKTIVIASTSPLNWDNGLKLMEHSYYEAEVVRAAIELLKTRFKGHRFVWAGDYADETIGDKNVYSTLEISTFESLLDTTTKPCPWDGSMKLYSLPEEYGRAKYLLNYDKKQAVVLEPPIGDDERHIHPLPLLTAESNGQGGGDYWGNEGAELVGSWKYDHIGAANQLPEGYEILEVTFKED